MERDSPVLADAKAVFETTCIDQLSDTAAVDTSVFRMNLGSIVPDWSSAVSSTTPEGDYQSIDVNISDSKYTYRVFQKDDEGEDVRIVRCDAKLVIVKDLESNNSSTYVLFYIPTNDYSRSHSGNVAEAVTNFRIPESYSGLKIWTRLNGTLVRVHRYQEGFLSDAVSLLNMENDEDIRIRTECVQRLFQCLFFQRGQKLDSGKPWPCHCVGEPGENDRIYTSKGPTLNPAIIVADKPQVPSIGHNDNDTGGGSGGSGGGSGFDNPEIDPVGGFDGYWDPNTSPGGGSGSGGNNQYPSSGQVKDFVKNTKYLGFSDKYNCFDLSTNIMNQHGCNVANSADKRNYTFVEERVINGKHKLVRTGDSEVAIHMIIERVIQDKPAMVGVHYEYEKKNKKGIIINDGTIDHFLVIYGYGYDDENRLYFDYQDTNRSASFYNQTHGPEHRLYYDSDTGFIKGAHFGSKGKDPNDYYVTHIRYTY